VLSDSLFAAFPRNSAHHATIQVATSRWDRRGHEYNIVQQAMLDGKAQSHLAPVPVANGLPKSGGNSMVAGQLLPPQAAAAAAALSRIADEVAHAMDQLVRKDMVTIRRSDFWIEVEMRTDILFPSGSARLATTRSTSSNASGRACALPEPHSGWKDIPTTSDQDGRVLFKLGALGSPCRKRRSGSVDPWRLSRPARRNWLWKSSAP